MIGSMVVFVVVFFLVCFSLDNDNDDDVDIVVVNVVNLTGDGSLRLIDVVDDVVVLIDFCIVATILL